MQAGGLWEAAPVRQFSILVAWAPTRARESLSWGYSPAPRHTILPVSRSLPPSHAGFLLVCTLVALDLALTNIAVALLAVAIQQCIVATNPAFTVTIESIVRRKLAHPMIYFVIIFLCTGPVVAQARRAPPPST